MIEKIKIKLPFTKELKKRINKGEKNIGVGCILIWKGFYIFLINANHPVKEWSFPTGKVEKNETPEQAVIREIKEETNLDAKIIKKFCILEPVNILNSEIIIYECEAKGIPVPANDIESLGVFKTPPSNLNKICRQILKKLEKSI